MYLKRRLYVAAVSSAAVKLSEHVLHMYLKRRLYMAAVSSAAVKLCVMLALASVSYAVSSGLLFKRRWLHMLLKRHK